MMGLLPEKNAFLYARSTEAEIHLWKASYMLKLDIEI